jgi:hypothetical protein
MRKGSACPMPDSPHADGVPLQLHPSDDLIGCQVEFLGQVGLACTKQVCIAIIVGVDRGLLLGSIPATKHRARF